MDAEHNSYGLIKLIGSPFWPDIETVNNRLLEEVYQTAFEDRVALLCLSIHRKRNWSSKLEGFYSELNERREQTLRVISALGGSLNEKYPEGYAIFKSLKPYPATPNDTDVIIFGGKAQFNAVLEHLYSKGYFFHEWAPMQTTVCDPRGRGKVGKGKKGGTYYIDIYSDISTDYFLYIDKRSLLPYVHTVAMDGTQVRTVRKEIELAIILFHNVFPERTFQLEHFYMPLYHLKADDFDVDVMVDFAEKQKLSYAISTNLTIVEHLHDKVFGFVPYTIRELLDRWGRNSYELERFQRMGEETPYLFSPKTFWITFLRKIGDNAALKSLFVQGLHMINPIFFVDVMKSLKSRFSQNGIYHLE